MTDLIREIANRTKKKLKRELIKDLDRTGKYTMDEMYNEAVKMYDKFIDQFYEYHTKYYIRHGQNTPGTESGLNLYRGQQIRKRGTYKNPLLAIDFSAADMTGGYEYNTPDEVLDLVMQGIRFTAEGIVSGKYHPDNKGKNWEHTMTWTGEYDGKYFAFNGTPKDAFDTFGNNFGDIAEEIFYEKFEDFGW